MIRPTLKLLRYLAPIAQGLVAAAPFLAAVWSEARKPFDYLPEMLDCIRSLRDDPWRPLNVVFVTSDGKRYKVIEDPGPRLPRFDRDSKAD